MGFYGKITNTSKTQFTFDKIYSNRVEMDTAISGDNNDGVAVGRYVLVDYDQASETRYDLINAFLPTAEEIKINPKLAQDSLGAPRLNFYRDSTYQFPIEFNYADSNSTNKNLIQISKKMQDYRLKINQDKIKTYFGK